MRMPRRLSRLIGPPLAGAAALLLCGMAFGIDPLVSLLVGVLVWAGTQLIWFPEAAGDRAGAEGSAFGGTGGTLSGAQREHLDRAEALVAGLEAQAGSIAAPGVGRALREIAGRAGAWIDRIHADPAQFGLYRKPLGSYLAQAADLAQRYRDAEAAGRNAPETASRMEASLDRLAALYDAVEQRGAATDRRELEARIAVLESEVDAEMAQRPGGPSGRSR